VKCPRCAQRIRGATWYCPNCGAPVESLNVADALGTRRGGRQRLALGAAAALTVAAVGIVLWSGGSPFGAPTGPGAAPVADSGGEAGGDKGDGREDGGDEDGGEDGAGRLVDASHGGGGEPPNSGRSQEPAAGQTPDSMATRRAASFDRPASALTPTPEKPVAPTTAAVATPVIRPGNPVWNAARISEAPTIDGSLDDWRSEPFEFASVVFGREHWRDGADLSGRAMFAWDETALYVGARIFDDVHSQTSSGADIGQGDSLELQLDTDLIGDMEQRRYDIDDWQIGFSPGDFEVLAPEAWVWRPAGVPTNGRNAIRLAVGRLPDGYIVEAAVPWTLLETRPMPGLTLGASLNVSDNDLPEPAQQTLIASSPSRAWSDPTTFGTLVLEP